MSLLIHFCTLRKCLVLVLQCHLKHFDYRSYNFTMSKMICFCTTLQTCFFFFSFMLNTGVNTVSASSGHNRKCSQGALILLVVHPPTLRCAAYTRHNFIFKMFWTVYNSQICSLGTPRDLLTESGAAPSQGKHCSVWTRAHTSQTQRDTTHGQTFHCGPACSAETCCDKCDSSFIKS